MPISLTKIKKSADSGLFMFKPKDVSVFLKLKKSNPDIFAEGTEIDSEKFWKQVHKINGKNSAGIDGLRTFYSKNNGTKTPDFAAFSKGSETLEINYAGIIFMPKNPKIVIIDGKSLLKGLVKELMFTRIQKKKKVVKDRGKVVPLSTAIGEMDYLENMGFLEDNEIFNRDRKFNCQTGDYDPKTNLIQIGFTLGIYLSYKKEKMIHVIDQFNKTLSVALPGSKLVRGDEVGKNEENTYVILGKNIFPSEFKEFLKRYGYSRSYPF